MSRVTLIGASVRALAQSAVKAGCKVDAIDLFGDQDLRAVAETCHAVGWAHYPHAFFEIPLPPGQPWCYTGGLENHPALLDALARQAPLWGNPSDVVRTVRDHRLLLPALQSAGIHTPKTLDTTEGVDHSHRWLVKNPQQSGGRHVRVWKGEPIQAPEILQERIEGAAQSTAFVGIGTSAKVLGHTEQWLVKDCEGHADDFGYVGSLGPIEPPASLARSLERFGRILVEDFNLQGLFGIDWIQSNAGVTIIEVNPRYTAGMEILEAVNGISLFHEHRRAFVTDDSRQGWESLGNSSSPTVGKRILFARERSEFTGRLPSTSANQRWADIPRAGTRFEVGEPMLTSICQARSREAVIDQLATMRKRFFDPNGRSLLSLATASSADERSS